MRGYFYCLEGGAGVQVARPLPGVAGGDKPEKPAPSAIVVNVHKSDAKNVDIPCLIIRSR